MKKIVSLVMVVAMLLSTMLFVVPTGASREDSLATAEYIDYIDALYFDKAPTVDGVVSVAEWGEKSFTVEATDCATKDDVDPYNRFIYWRTGDITDYNSWSYDVWFRWDENYFYVAAKVNDPDGHALKNGTTSTWNGDAIQMRIDPEGPNAVTGGEDFVVNENYTKPWSSASIPDFLFGYVQIAGGFTEAWENTSNKGMTSFSKNPMGNAQVVVAPCGSSYSTDTQNGITTYEIGIPWTYILNGQNDSEGNQITALTYSTYSVGKSGNRTGGIGREFGISLVILNDGTNPDSTWDAWMAWGSGICTAHQEEGARSATGSNSVMLSDAKVSQGSYQKQDPSSLLDATFSTANCDEPGVFYDYIQNDFEKTTPVKYDKLSVLTYDDPADVSIWGGEEGGGVDPTITDIGGSHGNVLDFSEGGAHKLFIQTSYGGFDYYYPKSYTLEFEVCVKGTVVGSESYDAALGNCFGGPNGTAPDLFFCGFNFNNNRFEICNTDALSMDIDKVATANYDLKKDNWYRWRFQYDNESCTCRLWVDDLTTTDDDGDGWGTMIFNTRWRYFYTTADEVILIWRMLSVDAYYDNVKIYNFGSISKVEDAIEHSESNGNGGSGTTTTTETGGGAVDIDVSKVYKKDGNWHVPVFVKNEYASATQLSFSLEYDASKAEFTGVEGLADGTYTVTETEKGKVAVIIKDFETVKALKAGDKYFEFILKATDDTAKAQDLALKLYDSYVYTVTTGDAMTFIVIGGVFAIAIGVTVVAVRRKKEEE